MQGIQIRGMRDMTQGGLALPTVLCEILGLPLYPCKEDNMLIAVALDQANSALGIIRGSRYGSDFTVFTDILSIKKPGQKLVPA